MIDGDYKICKICCELKPKIEFYAKKSNADGLMSRCKQCEKTIKKKIRESRSKKEKEITNKYMIEWRKNNTKKVKDYFASQDVKDSRTKWRAKNKEKIAKQVKDYTENNKGRLRKIEKVRRKEAYYEKIKDPFFKIKESIRSIIRRAFSVKSIRKNNRSESILGCSYLDFKVYIESKFESWMTYDNYGKYNGENNFGWDIDHIIPISSAKTEEDVIKLNHYTNLQPLCSRINRDVKRGRTDYFQ
jgi:hypothetical protein